ncbi:hypothetical protein [Mesotoga sp.]|uniref:hypothetical protein n=1 Tax=Mesotoga sp. TaxID=2053577 RepID=UPI00345E7CAB
MKPSGGTIEIFEDHIIFAMNIPQEAVVIPETIDGIKLQLWRCKRSFRSCEAN